MAGEIKTAPLSGLVDLTLSSVDKKTKTGEQEVRLCNYMDVYNNNFIDGNLNFMAATASEREIARCSLSPGDVVITKDSEKHDDIGVPALVREDIPDLVCGYHLAILRPKPPKVDGPYLYYALQNQDVQNQFHSFANGITRFGLRKSDIERVEVPCPPLDEQQAIAHILGTLDDKIELNRRMNRTLEEIAQAIFQDWFVDFGPTRTKMEGQEPYLPPELWDKFPDQLVDSELGEIPEGWEAKTLSEFASLNPESWSKSSLPEEIEYVDLANTKWGTITSTQHLSRESAPSRARRVLRAGDTIIGTVRPGNGSFSLVGRDNLTGSTGFAALRPIHHQFRELVYLAATDPDNIERLANRADGAAYPAVSPEVVAETSVVVPKENCDLPSYFSNLSGPVIDKMEGNQSATRTLTGLRDELLPRLLSGELKPE